MDSRKIDEGTMHLARRQHWEPSPDPITFLVIHRYFLIIFVKEGVGVEIDLHSLIVIVCSVEKSRVSANEVFSREVANLPPFRLQESDRGFQFNWLAQYILPTY